MSPQGAADQFDIITVKIKSYRLSGIFSGTCGIFKYTVFKCDAVSVSKDPVVKYVATVTFNGEEYTAESDEMTQKTAFGTIGRIIALFRKLVKFFNDLLNNNKVC